MADQQVHELFVAHYQDTKDKVFNYLMYRLNFDRDTCEDLLMDIVLKAYEKFSQFDSDKGSFKNWIFGIAHHHLLNFWRDGRPTDSLDEMEEAGAEMPHVDPEESVSAELMHREIQKILEMLTAPEKEILTLRYISDLSHPEIADVLDKSEGAVRTSLSRALEHFKTVHNKLYEKPE